MDSASGDPGSRLKKHRTSEKAPPRPGACKGLEFRFEDLGFGVEGFRVLGMKV